MIRSRPGLVWLAAVAAALVGAVAPTPWWQLGLIAVAVLVCAAAGRIRAPALRWGLIAALLFVVLRLVYRIVFTSTVAPPADAVLLLDLPVIPLGGPFRGISLLGPLTLAQVLATLADASRFAVVFVVFGAANALADARRLLARAPRLMLPIATVLALALGTVPALLSAVQRVARAARLRGERRGLRLLAPVFEQAVERAGTLGASMELRGFSSARGSSPSRAFSPSRALPPAETSRSAPIPPGSEHFERSRRDGGTEVLRAEQVSLAYGGRRVLRDVDLSLAAGELVVVTGPTGSGKSSLLALLAGLAPAYTGGEVEGLLVLEGETIAADRLRPARTAGFAALVPQRVEHSFLAETVREELAFAPGRRGLAGEALAVEIDACLERFRLTALAERDPATLSAGEATRAVLAAASLTRPRLLLLDEPIADLDPDSAETLLDILGELLAEGAAVVVAEHRPEPLGTLEGRVPIRRFDMRSGVLRSGTADRTADHPAPPPTPAHVPPASIVLARDLVIAPAGEPLLRVGELSVAAGEATVLSGPNGSGKTSLLEEIALAAAPRPGDTGTALVPHRVDDLLIRDTVAAECRFADRRAGAPRGATAERFERLIEGSIPEDERAGLAARHPRDLSAGTRLALGVAVQLAHAPRVLLLDEPTRGLDLAARHRLAGLIAGLCADGAAVLLATHDDAFETLLREAGAPTRRLRIAEGVLA